MSLLLLTSAQGRKLKNSVMSQRDKKETLFETSLKSQDDFCIKYKTFQDDVNGDVQNVEKVP